MGPFTFLTSRLYFFLPLLLALAVACAPAATPTPMAAPQPTPTVAPTPTPTQAPAVVTPLAATPTPTLRPAPTPTVTPVPRPAEPKVARLIVATSPFPHEVNLPWLTTYSGTFQHAPMMEQLISADRFTGKFEPMLATRWQMSPDGKTWTFWLKEGVPFHFGFGNFTAKDVVHSMVMMTQPEAIHSDTGWWRARLGKDRTEVEKNIEIVNDHQVVYHLKQPEVRVEYHSSLWRGFPMLSKVQWDKEGKTGFDRKPAGTGPYQYKERQLGAFIRFERLVDKHWRQTPDFKELEIRSVPEDATRLATLLTEEVHMSEVPRPLEKQAVDKGFKVISSRLPSVQLLVVMGGLYFSVPGKPVPGLPWADVKVRRALNHAINVKEIWETIYKKQPQFMRVAGFDPRLGPFNPEWDQKAEEMYGYNPVKAKVLLAEAGYPRGFKVKIAAFRTPGDPELPEVSEALGIYFKAIGLEPEIVSIEFARIRELFRKFEAHEFIYPLGTGNAVPEDRIRSYHTVINTYRDEVIDRLVKELFPTVDPVEREKIILEIGNYKFNNYTEIPLFFLNLNILVNPKVVAEYVYPGATLNGYTHLEYVKAAR